MRDYGFVRIIASLVLIMTAIPFLASAATAQQEDNGTSSVEVLKRVCPPGFEGPDYFEECDEPQGDIQFSLNGLQGTTDAEGSVLFFELSEGTYTITEDTLPAVEYGYVVYCRLAEDPDAAIDFDYVGAGPTDAGIELFLEADTDIICGWYNVPEPLPDPTPTPVPPTPTPIPPTPTPTPRVELDTHPVNIEAGRCPDLGEIIFELVDVELREGEEIGFPGPVPVAESMTTVNATIDELTDEEHMIVVYHSLEEPDTVIACGQIGGVPRDTVDDMFQDEDFGGFAIRLSEVDNSGIIGIADLTPAEIPTPDNGVVGEEPLGIEVTVYLTLIEDDPENFNTAA